MSVSRYASLIVALWLTIGASAQVWAQSAYATLEAGDLKPTLALTGRGIDIDRIDGCDSLAQGGDWIDDQDRTYRRIVPRPCAVSHDNPPLFWWAPHLNRLADARYVLTIAAFDRPDASLTFSSAHPYYRVAQTLAPGIYRWQVAVETPDGIARSRTRWFKIDASLSMPILAPPAQEILSTLIARHDRPRLFPADDGELLEAARNGVRRIEFERLLRSADRYLVRANETQGDTRSALEAITVLAIAWRMSGQDAYLSAGRRRMLDLARVASTTDSQAQAETCNYVTGHDYANTYLALARGYDLMGSTLTPAERHTVLAAALTRIGACTRDFVTVDMFSRSFAYRSHEANHLHYLMQALVLLAGEDAEIDRRLLDYWELYCSAIPVWGMQDGSDGNGTGYGWANFIEMPVAFLTLRNALGTDYFSHRSHFRNLGRRLVYFSPPVPVPRYPADSTYARAIAPAHAGPINVFGDGESDIAGSYWSATQIDRAFRIYATLVDEPIHRWYRQQGIARYPFVDETDFQPMYRALSMLAPLAPVGPTDFPTSAANVQAFPDTGSAAWHSDLADPQRTSLYFLSGPFGSFNHSEPEHNSFVFHMAGEPVLINAGYYDSYLSAHHAGYTRHTRAKNAMTYDGGRGQAETVDGKTVGSMDFAGQLLNAKTDGALFVVTGDATAAYRVCNGAAVNPGCSVRPYLTPISAAIRSIASLRDQAVGAHFIYDRIVGHAPHVWEWNLHSFHPYKVLSTGEPFTVQAFGPSGGPSVCVDVYGPQMEFTQTSGFPIAPAEVPGRPDRYPTQWHAIWRTKAPTVDATFLVVLREHCAGRAFKVERDQPNGTARVVINPGDALDAHRWLTFDGVRVRTYGGLR